VFSNFLIYKVNNPCSSSPCLNNGQCSLNAISCSYQCTCQQGFTGFNCANSVQTTTTTTTLSTQSPVDVCLSSSPCSNNALCLSLANSFQCICLPGFTGLTCQIQTVTLTNLRIVFLIDKEICIFFYNLSLRRQQQWCQRVKTRQATIFRAHSFRSRPIPIAKTRYPF